MKLNKFKFDEIANLKLKDLTELAQNVGMDKIYKYKKDELIMKLIEKKGEDEKILIGCGELDILPDGYGFLRQSNVVQDIYLSASQIKKFASRIGDIIIGEIREPVGEEKNYAILKIILVNGDLLEKAKSRPKFDDLLPSYPTEKIHLETNLKENLSGRMIDLIAPIGKGQRGLIVAPPKAGKTILISQMANSIIENYPDLKLWILLIDERPEEVTDIKNNVKDAEVFASTFDEEPHNHLKVTEMVLEKAKRLVEEGKDIFILMDSLTRLARSYNIIVPSSGKLISGGIDPAALYFPKKFFGAARNIKNGGSLTIIATALVDTGSKMDDVIYEEFKGTGNMEIHLDRHLAELRIFPAIDVKRSGTRREELLISEKELEAIWNFRNLIANDTTADSSKKFIELIKNTKNNDDLLNHFSKGVR